MSFQGSKIKKLNAKQSNLRLGISWVAFLTNKSQFLKIQEIDVRPSVLRLKEVMIRPVSIFRAACICSMQGIFSRAIEKACHFVF
jgi:hypothetical protein